MKPKPLDLDKIRCRYCKFAEWSPSDNTLTCKLTERVVRPEFTCIVLDELGVKQLIKSACEFYLKYKDKPAKLVKEHSEYREEVDKMWYKWKKRRPSIHSAMEDFVQEYNEWLFKLAFKDVFENDEEDDAK